MRSGNPRVAVPQPVPISVRRTSSPSATSRGQFQSAGFGNASGAMHHATPNRNEIPPKKPPQNTPAEPRPSGSGITTKSHPRKSQGTWHLHGGSTCTVATWHLHGGNKVHGTCTVVPENFNAIGLRSGNSPFSETLLWNAALQNRNNRYNRDHSINPTCLRTDFSGMSTLCLTSCVHDNIPP